VKQFIAPFVLDPEAHLAEPVLFEVLRSARPEEARLLESQFATLPMLPTPADLWRQAIALGQACRQAGRTVASLDLLVAAVALHHNAVLVSFDADFEAIASVSELRLQRLRRPA
jgi:predicted nucleic acid-binding protein